MQYITLTNALKNLPKIFVRVNSNCIINRQHVKHYSRSTVTLDNGEVVKIGRPYKEEVFHKNRMILSVVQILVRMNVSVKQGDFLYER